MTKIELPTNAWAKAGPPPLAHVSVDMLLTAREAAAYRRQGVSTFWRDVKEGRVSPPIRIAPKSPRWRLSDLCPPSLSPEAAAPAHPKCKPTNTKK